MPISNFSTDGQADARALIFAAAVEPLEDDENLVGKFRVEADPVVAHHDFADPLSGNGHVAGIALAHLVDAALDGHLGPVAFLLKLEGVADEILEKLPHLHGVSL